MYSFSACDVLPDAGLDKIANFSTHIVGGRESRVFTEPKRADPSDICLVCFYVYFTLIGVHWAKKQLHCFCTSITILTFARIKRQFYYYSVSPPRLVSSCHGFLGDFFMFLNLELFLWRTRFWNSSCDVPDLGRILLRSASMKRYTTNTSKLSFLQQLAIHCLYH
jgi:hypothetical protein